MVSRLGGVFSFALMLLLTTLGAQAAPKEGDVNLSYLQSKYEEAIEQGRTHSQALADAEEALQNKGRVITQEGEKARSRAIADFRKSFQNEFYRQNCSPQALYSAIYGEGVTNPPNFDHRINMYQATLNGIQRKEDLFWLAETWLDDVSRLDTATEEGRRRFFTAMERFDRVSKPTRNKFSPGSRYDFYKELLEKNTLKKESILDLLTHVENLSRTESVDFLKTVAANDKLDAAVRVRAASVLRKIEDSVRVRAESVARKNGQAAQDSGQKELKRRMYRGLERKFADLFGKGLSIDEAAQKAI